MIRLNEVLSLRPHGSIGFMTSAVAEAGLIKYSNWQELPVQDGYVTDGVELRGVLTYTNDAYTTSSATETGYIGSSTGESTSTLRPRVNLNLETGNIYTINLRETLISGNTTVSLYNGSSYEYRNVVIDSIGIHSFECKGTAFIAYDATSAFSLEADISVQKVIQESNKRYIKDEGISPKYPLALNSGQGKYFNGVNSYIPIDDISLIETGMTFAFTASVVNGLSDINRFLGRDAGFRQISYYDGSLYFNSGPVTEIPLSVDIKDGVMYNYLLTYIGRVIVVHVNNDIAGTAIASTDASNVLNAIGKEGSIYYQGILKDLYIFNRVLTEAERTKQYQYPEDFFIDVKTGVVTDCVLNMPMNDKDDNVRDYSRYSEGNELNTLTLITGDRADEIMTVYSNTPDNVEAEITTAGTVGTRPNFQWKSSIPFIIGRQYLTSFDIESISGTTVIDHIGVGSSQATKFSNYTVTGKEHIEFVHTATSVQPFAPIIYIYGRNLCHFKITNTKCVLLTGINPITNPTSDTNDLAKQLPYGLQDSRLVTDSLGVIESKSPFLEGNGLSYGDIDTSNWLLQNNAFSVETILGKTKDGMLFGIGGGYDKLRIVRNDNIVYIQLNQTSGGSIVASNTDEYVHVVLAYDGNGTIISYVNGINTGSASGLVIDESQVFRIGYLNSSQTGNGVYRLTNIIDHMITQEEVTEVYSKAVNKGLLS